MKDGVLLCELVNKVKPDHIRKVSKSKMPFPQRENIKNFTDAVRDVFNVPDRDNFVSANRCFLSTSAGCEKGSKGSVGSRRPVTCLSRAT